MAFVQIWGLILNYPEQFDLTGKLFSGDFTNIPNFPNLPNLPNLAGLNIQLPIHLNGINLLNPSANGKGKSFYNDNPTR